MYEIDSKDIYEYGKIKEYIKLDLKEYNGKKFQTFKDKALSMKSIEKIQ